MKFVITLIMLIFILGSCGKKSDPQYQGLINRAFYELGGLLRRPGRIITVDYNTPQIKEAVAELNMETTPLIEQTKGVHYMASILKQWLKKY